MPHFEPCRMCGKIDCKCLCGIDTIRQVSPPSPIPTPPIRTFETGATRDIDQDKLDYEGYLSPLVLQRFAQYMRKHQVQSDGQVRKSDNWQKGIPKEVYMKSLVRHLMELWLAHDGYTTTVSHEESLCAIIFNAHGYLFEKVKGRQPTQCMSCGGPSNEKDILYYGCCIKCAHEPINPITGPPGEILIDTGWKNGFWLCGQCGVKNQKHWTSCSNCRRLRNAL